VERGRKGRLIRFPVLHELCEPLERIVLLPVHVRFDLSVEANGDAFFGEVPGDAGGASFVVVHRVSGAFVVDTGTEINARHRSVLLGLHEFGSKETPIDCTLNSAFCTFSSAAHDIVQEKVKMTGISGTPARYSQGDIQVLARSIKAAARSFPRPWLVPDRL
jgi:hypothetical protein